METAGILRVSSNSSSQCGIRELPLQQTVRLGYSARVWRGLGVCWRCHTFSADEDVKQYPTNKNSNEGEG